MSAPQKVSFTIRRPTPVSRASSSGPDSDSGFRVPNLPRHLANNDSAPGSPLARSSTSSPLPSRKHDSDSSGEDEELQEELVTGFDRFGVQRANGTRKPQVQKPLVIPALQNKDWRDVARKRKSQARYLPNGADVRTGADGSVGGLGTKDTINSGPVLSGLQVRQRTVEVDRDGATEVQVQEEKMEVVEETEDQKALRAILAGVDGDDSQALDAIPVSVSEKDAYKQDVDELPDQATLDDYERVPVAQFGAALLRGMGWKEGQAASRKGKGLVEPYLPEARPALLGIGAKEKEVFDDGRPQNRRNTRPERRYVPVVRRDRDGNVVPDSSERDRGKRRSPQRDSAPSSRRSSRSPDRYEKRKERESGRRDRDYDYDYDRRRDRDRDRERDSSSRRGRDRDR